MEHRNISYADLPYGRGGSPAKSNQKRTSSTIVSALRCSQELDEGDIYLKKSFNSTEVLKKFT